MPPKTGMYFLLKGKKKTFFQKGALRSCNTMNPESTQNTLHYLASSNVTVTVPFHCSRYHLLLFAWDKNGSLNDSDTSKKIGANYVSFAEHTKGGKAHKKFVFACSQHPSSIMT